MDDKLKSLILHNFPDANHAASENAVLKLFTALEKQVAWLKDNYEPTEPEVPEVPEVLTVTSNTELTWDSANDGDYSEVVITFDRAISVVDAGAVTVDGATLGTVTASGSDLTVTFDPAVEAGDITVTVGVGAVEAGDDAGVLAAPAVITVTDTAEVE